jgi:hypothetical protein
MEYRIEHKVSNFLFTDTQITKEQVIREMVSRLLDDIPIEEIKSIFKVEFIEGTHKNLDDAFSTSNVIDNYLNNRLELIQELAQDNLSLYRCEINSNN